MGDGGGTQPSALRTHQRLALEALERAERAGARRAWVVLPPGAGKTLVGLETARRRGGTTVVLGPNTAIQGQWLRGWDALGGPPAGDSRGLTGPFTALTYQAMATFDPESEGDRTDLVESLHPHGRALVERLRQVGDLTLVLDECHHLLEVWGRLLQQVLDDLPDAFVLGLTATPPSTMTKAQHALVSELFGETVFSASIPAVVREGDLAPFAELAWLTTPTGSEREWLRAQGERFAELTTALTDPAYGTTGFLPWLDARCSEREWRLVERTEPDLADAALRMAYAGLLTTPPGARLTERHRHRPTADDWVLLLEDWVAHLRTTGRDDEVVERVRAVLPSVGYQLTRSGVRRGRSPVDRVLARSESKVVALTEIVAAEHANLGERMRMLVLCDHERATATVPADLHGVVDEQAGSAVLALEHLQRTVSHLHPLLVTGSTVGGSHETLAALRDYVGDPDLRVEGGRLVGPWSSRDWVPWATRFFEDGRAQVLVGTRGLLGEGWDAQAVTGLVDLTSATTSTAVVQTRGRALRVDPGWPEKVAISWTVVCVSDEHPKGGNDWDRFVRKHDGFYGVDEEGAVVLGVAHVDETFSAFAPPPVESFGGHNAHAVVRSQQRDQVRAAWAVGTPYSDELVHTIRLTDPRRRHAAPPVAVLHPRAVEVRDRRPSPWRPHPLVAVALVAVLVVFLLNLTPGMLVAILLAIVLGMQTTVAVDRGRVLAEDLARPPSLDQVAFAVADGLHDAGLSPVGAGGVRLTVDEHGEHRCHLDGVDADVSATFAASLDEVVSPMRTPRYVVPRWTLAEPVDNAHGLRVALGRLRPDGEVWHSVPSVLGTTKRRAQSFERSWQHWVGGGPALYTGSPEGEGVLATHRGSDPFDVTTVLRTQWR